MVIPTTGPSAGKHSLTAKKYFPFFVLPRYTLIRNWRHRQPSSSAVPEEPPESVFFILPLARTSRITKHTTMQSFKISAKSDAIILLVVFFIIVFLSIQFDLFERVMLHLSENDRYEIDEFIISAALCSFLFTIYAFRRWRESLRSLQAQNEAVDALQSANGRLSQAMKELAEKQKTNTQLSRLGNFLQACKSREEAFQFISNAASSLFNECNGAIFITRESRKDLYQAVQWGEKNFPDFSFPMTAGASDSARSFSHHQLFKVRAANTSPSRIT